MCLYPKAVKLNLSIHIIIFKPFNLQPYYPLNFLFVSVKSKLQAAGGASSCLHQASRSQKHLTDCLRAFLRPRLTLFTHNLLTLHTSVKSHITPLKRRLPSQPHRIKLIKRIVPNARLQLKNVNPHLGPHPVHQSAVITPFIIIIINFHRRPPR